MAIPATIATIRLAETVVEVVSAIIGLATGLLAGLMTGFYFERRSTRNLRAQNQDLRMLIYSLGAPQDKTEKHSDPRDSDLTSRVTARALATQDAAGRVRRQALIAYFVEKGERVADVEDALRSLYNVGLVKKDGEWLRMN